MERIVKYCSSCDLGFAQTFGFCPTCGTALETFQLDAIEAESADTDLGPAEKVASASILAFPSGPADDLPAADDGFNVTVIEDKNVRTRNALLLGTLGFMICALLVGVVISIFNKDMDIGAINGGDLFNAVIETTTPLTVDEEKKQKEDAGKNGRGGGGGGDHDPNPASAGVRPPMRRDPQMAPSTSMDRLTNPSIPVQMAIKGPMDEKDTDRSRPYGLKYGATTLSDGPGSNGGIGSGRDRGVGDSTGPGFGPGKNGGIGGGPEGGTGRDGDEIGTRPPAPPVGVTQAMRIIDKPKPSYTDGARQHLVQGTVILRVTFLANGSIGNVSAVNGLPDGLTEQAIAAARSIRFEPAKVNGQNQTVTKQVEYRFSIF